MRPVNMVLCGLGGQGILFMTKVLAEAALEQGLNVMGAETHGMAQRGGSVVSHLRLGHMKGSLVTRGCADYLLALDENEGYRNLTFLREGGGMYTNAVPERFPRDAVSEFLVRKGVRCHALEASRIAMEMEAPLSTNLALIGFFSAFNTFPISSEPLRGTLERITPDRFKKTNLRVFDKSHEIGTERSRHA